MSLRNRIDRLFRPQADLDLTTGGIVRPLLYLSLPIVITNLLQTAYSLTDMFWIGQYNTAALAAISFAFPVVILLVTLGLGISIAGSVLVAQHIGADDESRAEFVASQTITFSIIVSFVLTLLSYVFVDEVAVLLTGPDLAPLVAEYLQIYCLGLVFVFGFEMFISLSRGYGDTVSPMIVMLGTVILNIFLDPLLIFGFEANPLFVTPEFVKIGSSLYSVTGFTGLGVGGVALATVISQVLAFAVALWFMLRGVNGVRIRLGQMWPDRSYARRMVKIGLPVSVEFATHGVSGVLLVGIVAAFAPSVGAAYGIGTGIMSIVFLPALAISQGNSTRLSPL